MGEPHTPLRVAMIAGSYPPTLCGVADYTWRLVRALRARGLAVEVYTRQPRPSGAGALGGDGEGVHRVVPRWGLVDLRRLLAGMVAQDPDVIHLQHQTALFEKGLAITLLPWAARRILPRARTVVTLHDLIGPRVVPRVPRAGRPALRFLARRTTGVVVTNEVDHAALVEWGLPEGKVRLMPVGPTIEPQSVGEADIARLREELGVASGETLFAFFGLVMRDKGLATLIEAAALLPPSGWKLLLLATAPGAREARWRGRLQELAATLGVADRLVWRENLPAPDVSRHLAASNVGVLPFEEGLATRRSSFAVMAAHGLPVVSTTPRVWPRVFGSDSPALLVPPHHPDKLACAMRSLLVPGREREELARRCLVVAGRLSWEECARETEALYRWISPGTR